MCNSSWWASSALSWCLFVLCHLVSGWCHCSDVCCTICLEDGASVLLLCILPTGGLWHQCGDGVCHASWREGSYGVVVAVCLVPAGGWYGVSVVVVCV